MIKIVGICKFLSVQSIKNNYILELKIKVSLKFCSTIQTFLGVSLFAFCENWKVSFHSLNLGKTADSLYHVIADLIDQQGVGWAVFHIAVIQSFYS